jgi:chaperone BCS1
MLEVPARSALLFEDISDLGLINALDGVTTKEGLLTFMTSNHYLQLDETLVRPGRVDVPVEFTYASRSQVERMFEHFYEKVDSSLPAEFAAAVAARDLTMAEVQQHLLNFKGSPVEAVAHAGECGAGSPDRKAGRAA